MSAGLKWQRVRGNVEWRGIHKRTNAMPSLVLLLGAALGKIWACEQLLSLTVDACPQLLTNTTWHGIPVVATTTKSSIRIPDDTLPHTDWSRGTFRSCSRFASTWCASDTPEKSPGSAVRIRLKLDSGRSSTCRNLRHSWCTPSLL